MPSAVRLIIASAFCLVSVSAQQSQAWRQLISDGLEALKKSAYADAEKLFTTARDQARALGPLPTAESLLYLGLVYERQNQLSRAEPCYEQATELREQVLPADSAEVSVALELDARVLEKMVHDLGSNNVAAAPLEILSVQRASRAEAIRTALVRQRWGEPADAGALQPGREGGVSAPRLLERQDPEYSEEGRLFRQEGRVQLRIEVRPDGRAHNISLMRSLGLGLDEKAAEAVSAWKFAPGTKAGQPVTVSSLVTVHFRLL